MRCWGRPAWAWAMCLAFWVPPTRCDKIDSVVIMTQGRSGSTFIGELLSKAHGALYLYEPCRSITMTLDEDGVGKFGPVDEGACQAMVARLLGCSITEADATALFQDWVAITKCNVRAVVDLAPKRVTVDAKVAGYNALCAKSSLRIVKEIRLVTPGPTILKRASTAVLHLVRDVRAVVNSRVRLEGFCLHKGAPGCARPICEDMDASFSALGSFRASPRYRLVRFEDVCDSPLQASMDLYKWLGVTMRPEAAEWVETSTHATDAPEGAGKYGTQRSDPSQVAHGWETDLGLPEIEKINAICGSILAKLGYEVDAVVARISAAGGAGSGGAAGHSASAAKEPWWKKNAAKMRLAAGEDTSPPADTQRDTRQPLKIELSSKDPWWKKKNAKMKEAGA